MNILEIKVLYFLTMHYYFSREEYLLYQKIVDILVKFTLSPYSGLSVYTD